MRQHDAAQVFWLEQSHDRITLGQCASRLVELLDRPEDGLLRRAILRWFDHVLPPRREEDAPIQEALGLKEFKVMLEQRIEQWNRELREEGRQEGLREGEARLLLRLLERKFGRLDPQVRERVRGADADRLLDWGERMLSADRLEDVFEN